MFATSRELAGGVLHQPLTDGLKTLRGRGLQSEVIQSTAAPHGRLAVRLGIALDREHVEFGVRPNGDSRHGLVTLVTVGLRGSDLGVKTLV